MLVLRTSGNGPGEWVGALGRGHPALVSACEPPRGGHAAGNHPRHEWLRRSRICGVRAGRFPTHVFFRCARLFTGSASSWVWPRPRSTTVSPSRRRRSGCSRCARRKTEVPRTPPAIGRAAVVAALMALPVYLRNWLMLGTPIYPPPPFLARRLHAKWFSYEASVALQRYVMERGQGLGRRLSDFSSCPGGSRFIHRNSMAPEASELRRSPSCLLVS